MTFAFTELCNNALVLGRFATPRTKRNDNATKLKVPQTRQSTPAASKQAAATEAANRKLHRTRRTSGGQSTLSRRKAGARGPTTKLTRRRKRSEERAKL